MTDAPDDINEVSHSCDANLGPNISSCASLHSWFLSGCTVQCNLIGKNRLLGLVSASTHV